MPLESPPAFPFIPCYNNEAAAGADWPVIVGQVGVEAIDRALATKRIRNQSLVEVVIKVCSKLWRSRYNVFQRTEFRVKVGMS